MFAKRNWFHLIFRPLLFNKRSNFIILSLFNGGVIYISPLYEFLFRKGTFLSLGRFSNNQKIFIKPSFSGCKIFFHPIYCPTHTHNQSLAWKILVSIKNNPLTLVHNSGQVFAIPCYRVEMYYSKYICKCNSLFSD